MAKTSIEWTDATWNPVAGCTVLTTGCTNCYAMRMAARLDAMGQRKYEGLTRQSGERVWTGKIRLDQKSIETPTQRPTSGSAPALELEGCGSYARRLAGSDPITARQLTRVYR
jgi:protein gp37